MKVEKRTMCTVFNSGNNHVVDHTSLQNLVSVSVRRLQHNTWYLSQWLPHLIHTHYDDCYLLGCDALQYGRCLPTYLGGGRGAPILRLNPENGSGIILRNVSKYQITQCHIPEMQYAS
jgi:hypothetical protein